MDTIAVTYVHWLVAASIATSVVASYAAFSFAERVAASDRQRSLGWLIAGAFAMGLGIWSMHYLGMLAVQLPVPVVYHVPTVIISLLLAVAASAAVLWVVSRESLSGRAIVLGSVAMGGGIGAMHYTGMAAMRSYAMHRYNPSLVLLSLVIAVAFSWMALRITFLLRREPGAHELRRMGGAVLMGIGIASMHYTAMFAVTFERGNTEFSTVHTVPVTHIDQLGIVVMAGMVLFGALISAYFDRQMSRDLRVSNERLAEMQVALLQREKELKEAVAKLEELSTRDGLTGLYNRRFFDTTLTAECKRAARANYPISLLIIDVDCFKALNDHYGHLVGDDCLQKVGKSLASAVRRTSDVVARYGGEEFALILPNTSEESATTIGENIRRAVLGLEIANANSTAGPFVTLSVGVCTRRPSHPRSSEDILVTTNEIIRAADEALYRAKREGRNRVLLGA
ncbi:diguanylate cyclase [Candidatus Koribacter versatilis Ellin345]|uniref:diguanylate cyclase n=1 Tax=Koribacter versatilis (strain Ellin345) TaxID=204669 RepID=Q1IV91_KORVE|nr:diguanylate cyclase [Candidatus Koribacter versatilis]ABF39209.1 diguanylate cyclase [Candidatus Koribacter versatilis Ellin345]